MGKFFRDSHGDTDWGKISLMTQAAGPLLGMATIVGLGALVAKGLSNYDVPMPVTTPGWDVDKFKDLRRIV